jgi:N-acetylneuraminic acid mutarotase
MRNKREYIRRAIVLPLAVAGLIICTAPSLTSSGLASAQATAPTWSYTGNLISANDAGSATLLPNGKVLVVGGGAELYDPATGTWSKTADPIFESGTATLLQNGKVLVVGGGAELYDPATGAWSPTGNLNTARFAPATLLQNGKVLVAGGIDSSNFATNTAELYDPVTGAWSFTGRLNSTRVGHTATLLQDGKVLVAGGQDDTDFSVFSTELYDPTTGTWSVTGTLNAARGGHTATLLPNGDVLLAGACNDGIYCGNNSSAELYNPTTGTWSITGALNTTRFFHTATLLPDGQVLIAGGDHVNFFSGTEVFLNSAEIYDPATGNWNTTANLNGPRLFDTATLLQNGNVLVVGGSDSWGGRVLGSTELYDSGAASFANPIDDAQVFVRQQYLDFLNREPDADGLAYWTNEIAKCGSDARCIHERRIGVSAAFFIEQEFQDSGYYVYRFYKASFGRQPNFAEFTSDRSKVIGGSSLEANKQAFADEWVQRPAFQQAYSNTMNNTEVVNKLFENAGLAASLYDPQRQQEIQAMNAGRSRALILRDVIEIPDFKNIADPNDPRYSELKQISQYNPAFVLMQYFGYLHRDLDQNGYDFWLDIVNNREPNNYRGMVCSFITSSEYQLRFGSAVTRSNNDCAP